MLSLLNLQPYNLPPTTNTGVIEQLIRPTGIVDPLVFIRPTKGQIIDLVKEIIKRTNQKEQAYLIRASCNTTPDSSQNA